MPNRLLLSPLQNRPCKFGWKKILPLLLLGAGLGITSGIMTKVLSADRIIVSYGPLEFSIPIADLELYARTGTITPTLANYTRFLGPQQLDQLRQALVASADLSPVAVAQFLYSSQGETILERVGQVIQTEARLSGFYALRASLILAAAEPEGLTALNVLQNFPIDSIRLNSSAGLEIVQDVTNVIQETEAAIAAVQGEFARDLENNSDANHRFGEQPDLTQPGPGAFSLVRLLLNRPRRDRQFPADLYLPATATVEQPAPVIVISHGLGSERSTFAYLARHLASYGFAVAVPEHPGSNAQQIQQLFAGLAQEISPPRELIDRPLDIRYLLDFLAQSYGQQLRMQDVGVLGQSFGGYTVLALAGAEINFERLAQRCADLSDFLNFSLLLQCDALELPRGNYQLSDPRVGAVIAINPLTSFIFGPQSLGQVAVPTVIASGSADTVTPALTEQIRPFTWLEVPQKYLLLLESGTHFSFLGEAEGGISLPEATIGPDPTIAQTYLKALSLVFFTTYVADNPRYEIYLTPEYARYLSQTLLPLYWVESLPENIFAPLDGNDEE
ncbi:MAG: alpha/beta hydrolase [Chloroflexaceae bacterium]|nr:alpha/beta hydrolase [Chloroflexaceae bacterium]